MKQPSLFAAAMAVLFLSANLPVRAADPAPASPAAPAVSAPSEPTDLLSLPGLALDSGAFNRARNAAEKALRDRAMPDVDAVKAEFLKLAEKYPDDPAIGGYAVEYIRLQKLAGADDFSVKREWQVLSKHPSAQVRKLAAEKLRSSN